VVRLERMAQRHGARLPKPVLNVADVDSVMRMRLRDGYRHGSPHALALHPQLRLSEHRLPVRFRKTIHLARVRTVPLGRAAGAFWDILTS